MSEKQHEKVLQWGDLGHVDELGGVCIRESDAKRDAEVAALRAEVARLKEERRWIPVGERLPEGNENVLVMDTLGFICDCWMRCGVWTDMREQKALRFVVTHWMPLSALPEVKK